MRDSARPRGLAAWLAVGVARGAALFLGVFDLLCLAGRLLGPDQDQNIWWIDLRRLPGWLALALQTALGVTLLLVTFHPPRRVWWRLAGALVTALFAVLALVNALDVWALDRAGTIHLGFPLPFSLLIALALAGLAAACLLAHRALPPARPRRPRLATAGVTVIVAGLIAVAFPLGQLVCFGKTDYPGPVDAIVVLGAKVMPDGRLSDSLADRVDAAIRYYGEGRAPCLIMSGGTGVEGVNEAEAMKGYAVERGVPAGAILVDPDGDSTQLTVAHTLALAEEHGFVTLGAVSSDYHLPRIKMLFLAQGHDVVTMPAPRVKESFHAKFRLREIPAWWWYFLRSVVA
jgi:vancomycin permeability regulator SanA